MKRTFLIIITAIFSAGYLYSEKFNDNQKKILPVMERSIGSCYKECKTIKKTDECNSGIDNLEEAMREMLNAASKEKISPEHSTAVKSAKIMNTYCPKEEKEFIKSLK